MRKQGWVKCITSRNSSLKEKRLIFSKYNKILIMN